MKWQRRLLKMGRMERHLPCSLFLQLMKATAWQKAPVFLVSLDFLPSAAICKHESGRCLSSLFNLSFMAFIARVLSFNYLLIFFACCDLCCLNLQFTFILNLIIWGTLLPWRYWIKQFYLIFELVMYSLDFLTGWVVSVTGHKVMGSIPGTSTSFMWIKSGTGFT